MGRTAPRETPIHTVTENFSERGQFENQPLFHCHYHYDYGLIAKKLNLIGKRIAT